MGGGLYIYEWINRSHTHTQNILERSLTAAGPLADGARLEAVVDDVLEVLAHADLPHQPVLVAVHPYCVVWYMIYRLC